MGVQSISVKIFKVLSIRFKLLKNHFKTSAYKDWVEEKPQANSAPNSNLTVSVIMATFNTPVDFLRIAVNSLLAQTSPNWELSIADDFSTSVATREELLQIKNLDPRISVHLKDSNSGISETLNIALNNSNGEFVGVLDHDDELHPRAIELTLSAAEVNPEAILIYSDEDKIDKSGRHSLPFFKPDFSPELLLSQMYLNHFTIMKTEIIKELGGFRREFDGAQDHDLALRMQLTNDNVVHVPKVLYHWRAWEESTAYSIDAKPWAQLAAQRVQNDAMSRAKFGGASKPSAIKGINEISWNVSDKPIVSVVIPTASRRIADGSNGYRLVDRCLHSLSTIGDEVELEICVVHTGDLEQDQRFIYRNSGIISVPYDRETFNFSHAVNLGVQNTSGEYVLLLNDDTKILKPDSIKRLVEFAQQPEVGVVGAKLTFPNGNFQHAGILLIDGIPTHPFHNAKPDNYGYYGSLLTPRNYLAVTAAAALMRREVFTSVNGFDEAFAHDYNDVDFCLRVIQQGLRNVWTPFAHFEHHEGASLIRTEAHPQETKLFVERYGDKYKIDPFYSPNLKQDLRNLYEFK